MMKMTRLMVFIGLLLIWLGGMLATEGQEAVTMAIIVPGIFLMAVGVVLHDRILARAGLIYDAPILDEDDDEDDDEDEDSHQREVSIGRGEHRYRSA